MRELEIEFKAYCSDHLAIINRLISLGGKFVKRTNERDIYFNHPSRNFIDTDEAFRIRRSGNDNILTYKGPKLEGRAKSRLEEEVTVSDYDRMKEILQHLGFIAGSEVIKTRDTYRINDIIVCLDIVEGLGDFVELEKKGSDVREIEDQLLALAENLGLKKFEKLSYLQLLEDKNSRLT